MDDNRLSASACPEQILPPPREHASSPRAASTPPPRHDQPRPASRTRGTVASVGYEQVGALGGITTSISSAELDDYQHGHEDLLDRRTILGSRRLRRTSLANSPFFERFYGGGIGSIRGFRFRGVSPRSGLDHDPVGGDFSVTGRLELDFPIDEEILRGVVFTDVGDVEPKSGSVQSAAASAPASG